MGGQLSKCHRRRVSLIRSRRRRRAVTRHPVFIVPSLLVDAVDEYRERHFAGEIVFDLAAPAVAEFVLNRLAPLDNRHDVGAVVRVQQVEAGAIVESAVKVDGLDL